MNAAVQHATVELLASELGEGARTCCPNPKAGMECWNSHPRVFFDLRRGAAVCPYCGTRYRLKDGEKLSAAH